MRVVGAVEPDAALKELVVLEIGGFGDAVLAVAPAGFRAAAVVEAVPLVVLALLGEEVALLGRVEVRRAVVEDVERFFSSSDMDGWLRWEVVEADVGGRFVAVDTEPGGGRVGGLLNPPAVVVVRDDELAVGFVAAFAVLVTPRRAGTEAVVVGLVAVVELVVVGLAEVGAGAGSDDAGASVGCTTSKPSASDMLGGGRRADAGRISLSEGRNSEQGSRVSAIDVRMYKEDTAFGCFQYSRLKQREVRSALSCEGKVVQEQPRLCSSSG